MDYRFLLGRSFDLGDRTWTVTSLRHANGRAMVCADAQVEGESTTREFPATIACEYLLVDEVIELREVSFIR